MRGEKREKLHLFQSGVGY